MGYGWGGGPCDYCVGPSPNNWVFGFFRLCLNLGSGFGPVGTGDRGLGLGLDNYADTLCKILTYASINNVKSTLARHYATLHKVLLDCEYGLCVVETLDVL